jgi:hypothetical protein
MHGRYEYPTMSHQSLNIYAFREHTHSLKVACWISDTWCVVCHVSRALAQLDERKNRFEQMDSKHSLTVDEDMTGPALPSVMSSAVIANSSTRNWDAPS